MGILAKNQQHTVDINGYTAEGLGIARMDGQVIFVHGAVSGERCVIRILKVRAHFAYGRVEKILSPSPARIPPDCPHAPSGSFHPACGGCQFRHVSYEEELDAKRQRVAEALRRVGGVTLPVPTIVSCGELDHYRNKCVFCISPQGKLGFYRARSHQVIEAAGCRIQPPQAYPIAHAIEEYLADFSVPIYDEQCGKGLVRHVFLRANAKGETLACIVANGTRLPHEEELTARILAAWPETVGIVLNTNTQNTNVILGEEYRVLWGTDVIGDTLCGFQYRISIPAFYQINRPQAERLYALAVDMAGLTGKEMVLDLYCGIGTLTLVLAQNAKRVIGCEIVSPAVEDAWENARRNGVDNVEFFQGDAGDVAKRFLAEGIKPDVIVVDPSRKGLEESVIQTVAELMPRRIVYVSCDPGTLARDVHRFGEYGYQAERVAAVDMFPRTCHVETVVQLIIRT